MARQKKGMMKSVALLIVFFVLVTATWAADFKTGTYSATAGGVKWSLTYDANGKVTVASDGKPVVEGTYKVTGDEIAITDVKGPMACGEGQVGKYKWKLEEKKLTFTKVEDECEGRAGALTGQTWMQE